MHEPTAAQMEDIMGERFARARMIMAEGLTDEGLRQAYQANIAMLLHDRYGITGIEERNQAAEDIIKLVFESQ